MNEPRITISPAYFDESPLYSFSSRANSPTIQHKISSIPFEFTENTRPGSFVSYQTPNGNFSSPYSTQDNIPKLNESTEKLQEKFIKIREDYESLNRADRVKLEIPERSTDNYELGIPTLKWCPFCRCENATEVFYENSAKTFWSSVGIFLTGGFFGCCLVPYMMDSCKDIKARCHRCKHVLDNQGF